MTNHEHERFNDAIQKIDLLIAISGAQFKALQLALAFIKQVGEWGLPYSSEAETVSGQIAELLLNANIKTQ